MKECKEVLESIPYNELEDFEKSIFNDIQKRMKSGDIKVFKINI
jgi:hypothetical protein